MMNKNNKINEILGLKNNKNNYNFLLAKKFIYKSLFIIINHLEINLFI